MGFGIGLGPRLFRVRVSARGVGISSGVGPFSVWANTGSGRRRSGRRPAGPSLPSNPARRTEPTYLPGEVTTTNLIGAGADELHPSSSDEVVAQINRAERWLYCWNTVGWILVAVSLPMAAAGAFRVTIVTGLLAFGIARIGFSRLRVSLHYEIDSVIASWYKAFGNEWSGAALTNGRWRLESNTQLHTLHHQKVNAGAGTLVTRHPMEFRLQPPRALKASINTPTVTAKQHSLVFLPDRILIKSRRRWSDIEYEDVTITLRQSNFVEDGEHAVPRDGQRVGDTWKYVNVKGGPDRRFNDNRLLPIMRYSEIALTSATGLYWELQLSRHDVADWLQYILDARPAPLPGDGSDPDSDRHHSHPMSAAASTPAAPVVDPLPPSTASLTEDPGPDTPVGERLNPAIAHRPPNPEGAPLQPWGLPSTVIEVAGEMHHEADITALFDGEREFATAEGAELRGPAVLVPDPDNPYGAGHAVAVYILGRHVGYVPHSLSTEYFPPVAAMASQGAAVTVDARVWAISNQRGTAFRARVSLSVARASEFVPPTTMPGGSNVVLLPAGNALQVTGEEEHLAILTPYLGQSVAVTLHTVVVTKAGEQSARVEVRLERNVVGQLTPATSAKVGPLVERVERGGGLSAARAVVRGNSLKADVTIYVARARDVDQDWPDTLKSAR